MGWHPAARFMMVKGGLFDQRHPLLDGVARLAGADEVDPAGDGVSAVVPAVPNVDHGFGALTLENRLHELPAQVVYLNLEGKRRILCLDPEAGLIPERIGLAGGDAECRDSWRGGIVRV